MRSRTRRGRSGRGRPAWRSCPRNGCVPDARAPRRARHRASRARRDPTCAGRGSPGPHSWSLVSRSVASTDSPTCERRRDRLLADPEAERRPPGSSFPYCSAARRHRRTPKALRAAPRSSHRRLPTGSPTPPGNITREAARRSGARTGAAETTWETTVVNRGRDGVSIVRRVRSTRSSAAPCRADPRPRPTPPHPAGGRSHRNGLAGARRGRCGRGGSGEAASFVGGHSGLAARRSRSTEPPSAGRHPACTDQRFDQLPKARPSPVDVDDAKFTFGEGDPFRRLHGRSEDRAIDPPRRPRRSPTIDLEIALRRQRCAGWASNPKYVS